MHSAPHRNNSDFQIRHFIAGSCHTADAAWNVLYEQMLDISQKLITAKANLLRRQARAIELEEQKNSIETQQDALRYEANLMEFKSNEGMLEMAIAGAEKELATIKGLMAELEPQRKYAHLPLLDATEAAQREEWKEEFKNRIENYLFSIGTVPHDQLDAMRKHPDFDTEILPYYKEKVTLIEEAKSAANAVTLLHQSQKLLGGGGNAS